MAGKSSVRLVIKLRETLQHPVIIWLIAPLERIHQDQPAAGLEHACGFADHTAAHLGGNSCSMKMLVMMVFGVVGDNHRIDGEGFGTMRRCEWIINLEAYNP
jgi:hypothetical protein